jgi:hypothetical protein
MAHHRKYDIVIVIALVLLGIAYGSFSSEFRLRSDMPVEFFDGSRLPPAKRASEEKVAAAYWACAVKQVQWKYGYASRLPDDPPPEFSVSSSAVGPVANDEAVRRQYWLKLRATWNTAGAWKTQYQWSSISFRQSLRSAGDWWNEALRGLIGK